MGGYGNARTREAIFGRCTQAVLETADLPVFMLP
jgi:nucleotide-binding universal stress UspA family protein